MKVSALGFPSMGLDDEQAYEAAEREAEQACRDGVELLVFPAYTGMVFGDAPGRFFEKISAISLRYPTIAFCPGTMREITPEGEYRCSELIRNGSVLLHQRQLYLSRSERAKGLLRGSAIEYADVCGFKACIIMGTDVFYPQVSRMAALEGAGLAVCPAAYEKDAGRALQLSGVWREAQSNLFFAVESCFCGSYDGKEYCGEQTIQAPLSGSAQGTGFLARGSGTVTAGLDKKQREKGIGKFDVLRQLNPEFYEASGMFGGRRE